MAGRRRRGKGPDKETLHILFLKYRRRRDPAVREQLVLAHAGLATYMARKFANRGEPLEDIVQVAQIGLLKAVDRYDPARGVEFSTYAGATIVGEIKRHFRDKFWSVHVPHRLRDLNNTLMRTADRLTQLLGRSPTIAEIASETGVSFEDTVEALEVGRAYSVASLDADVGDSDDDQSLSLLDTLGTEDRELVHLENRQTLEGLLQRIPEREQAVLRQRYYEGVSQAEIARRLGISQMHVSRIQRDALRRLRQLIAPPDVDKPPQADE